MPLSESFRARPLVPLGAREWPPSKQLAGTKPSALSYVAAHMLRRISNAALGIDQIPDSMTGAGETGFGSDRACHKFISTRRLSALRQASADSLSELHRHETCLACRQSSGSR